MNKGRREEREEGWNQGDRRSRDQLFVFIQHVTQNASTRASVVSWCSSCMQIHLCSDHESNDGAGASKD